MKDDIRHIHTGAAPAALNSYIIDSATLFGTPTIIDIEGFLKLLDVETCTGYGTENNATEHCITTRGGGWSTGTLGGQRSHKYEITGPNFGASVSYTANPGRVIDSLTVRPKHGDSITIQGRQINSQQAGKLLSLCVEISARTLAKRNAEQQKKFDDVISAITAA